ncbi:MAG: hypothetical protein Q8L47_00200 [bacterium]|nr:hypothetical protein [bacterium]
MARNKVNKKTILGLDLDGVILDHSLNKIELARQIGINLSLYETPSDIMVTKIEKNAYHSIQSKLYDDEKLARHTPLIPHAKESLHYIKSTGIPFVMISRRKTSDCAIISLKYHGLWPDYFDFTNTFFVSEKKDKDVKAKAIGVTHFVDDEPSVIDALESVPQRFLFDPLLVYGDLVGDFHKINSWDELIELIV